MYQDKKIMPHGFWHHKLFKGSLSQKVTFRHDLQMHLYVMNLMQFLRAHSVPTTVSRIKKQEFVKGYIYDYK